MRTGLEQRVAGSAEDSLRVLECLNLASTSFLAHVEKLQEPVAFGMQGGDVLQGRLELLEGGQLRSLVVLKGHLGVGLNLLLIGDALRVGGALFGRVGHQLLVLGLGVLLLSLGLCHLRHEILDEQVNHGNDTSALFALLGVGIPRLRRRRRGHLVVVGLAGAQLHEVHAHVRRDAILGGQLFLWWGLVQAGIVKFVQAILGNLKQLLCGGVRGDEVLVLFILSFALFRSFGDLLVELLDACNQGRDLLSKSLNRSFGLVDVLGLQLHGELELLLLVVGLIELQLAILFLVL